MAERTLGGKTVQQLVDEATKLAYARFVTTATPSTQYERAMLHLGAEGGAAAMLGLVFDIVEREIKLRGD